MSVLDALRPKWKNSDADVRQRAIAEITDPAILVAMIIRDSEWFVRHDAFGALRALDPAQEHYHRLMRDSGDEEIRRKAVKVMTTESEIERVSKEDEYQYVRDAASHRLDELRTGLWDDKEH